jgi:hypothetical protein
MKTAEELVKEYPDETSTIYNKGFKAGGEHSKPSLETLNLFNKMEEKFDTHLKYIKEAFNRNSEQNEKDHKQISDKIDNFIKGADDKFACKRTEREVEDIKTGIEAINKVREQRNYDWLKYGAITAITLVLSRLID